MELVGLKLEIPGRKKLLIKHLLLDFNGTLAVDGNLIPGIAEKLIQLSQILNIQDIEDFPCIQLQILFS